MAQAFRRKRWRQEQRLRVDVNGMMAPFVGAAGLADEEVALLAPRLVDMMESVERRRRASSMALPHLAFERNASGRVRRVAEQLRGRFDDLVVLAVGGSGLGARALWSALGPASGPSPMRVQFADTIDPSAFTAVLEALDLRRTVFDVVSRWGDTAETMSQFLIVRERLLKELGAVEYRQHFVVTTDPEHGTLRQVVNDEGFRSLSWPAGLSGQLATLSPVGLFPLACAGTDVAEILAGAADMEERCRTTEPATNPALVLAGALHLAAELRQCRSVVVVPCAERLTGLADWACQLWSDVLGAPGAGPETATEAATVPMRSVGPVQRHAHGRLLTEDPSDQVIVFLRLEEHAHDVVVPEAYADLETLCYLGGHRLGELVNLEQQAVELALAAAGRLAVTVTCPSASPFGVGQLVYLLELIAVTVAGLRGARPWDEAGAENRLSLLDALAGRPGYEGRRADAQRWIARREERYVV